MASALLVEYERWRPELAAMLDTRFYDIQWLDEAILSYQLHLFSGPNSCILATIKVYPTGARECHVMAAAGELNELASSTILKVLEFGKEQGCIMAVIESRPGWARVMEKYGWETHQVSVRKDL